MDRYHGDLPPISQCPGTLGLLAFFSLLAAAGGGWVLSGFLATDANAARPSNLAIIIGIGCLGVGLAGSWKTVGMLVKCIRERSAKAANRKMKRRVSGPGI